MNECASGLSPELRALLTAVRAAAGSNTPALSAFESLDWPGLIRLGRLHRVLTLLHRYAVQARLPVPPEVALEVTAQAGRNRYLCGELVRIMDALRTAGVRACLYKGPAVSLWS